MSHASGGPAKSPVDCPKCGMSSELETPQKRKTKTEYTCPIHPEVVQEGHGDCPKCGMALEPKTVAAEEEEDEEYIFMRSRFWVSVALTLPEVLIAMRNMLGLGSLAFRTRSRKPRPKPL